MGTGKKSRRTPDRGRDAKAPARPGPSPNRQILQFSGLFLAFLLVFSMAFSTDLAQRYVHAPTERLLTLMARPFLNLAGDVTVSDNHLSFNGFQAVLVEECNGILPMYIFVSAVLAFPSSWRAKWRGILIGIPSVFFVNLLRVICLMLLGAFKREIFDQVHIYVWQALIIAITVAIWAYWAETFVRPEGLPSA